MIVGRSASQIAVISAVSVRSTPSSVTIFSVGCARRTTTAGPRSFAKSKACSGWLDRKSTRLNSSHLGISYAVFCLKKKKKKKKENSKATDGNNTPHQEA